MNKISFFKYEQGYWIDDHTSSYFQQIYHTDHLCSNWEGTCYSPKSFHNLDLTTLDRPLHNLEVAQDIFSFKPFKSPGGIHPFLYQKILEYSW